MQASASPRIKICCIGSREEAELAIGSGAHALGFVSAMPSGPGPIEEALIAEIVARIPPPIATFLLTSRTTVAEIVAQQHRCRANTIQLVDAVEAGAHARLREALPGVRIVQVVHVRGPESVDEAVRLAPLVDAILLDSGDPTLPVKQLGGTGRVHNWGVSRTIRESVAVPVFLAGGLRSSNVREAVEAVHPFGVDLCSGVRTDGRLDPAKLHDFMCALRPN